MDESERRRLLGRVRRSSGTVGKDVPEEIDVQGTTVELKEFVFECKRLDAIPGAQRERIEALKDDLRRERLERKRRIEGGDPTEAEGERLVRSIHGIDRALNALEGLDAPDIGEKLRRKELEDARELLALADRAP